MVEFLAFKKMNPRLVDIFQQALYRQPPTEATRDWFRKLPDPVLVLESLHSQQGLPLPPLNYYENPMSSYFDNFHQLYLPLDSKADKFSFEQYQWTFKALAVMQDRPGLERLLSLYGRSHQAVVDGLVSPAPADKITVEVLVWLAQRGQSRAMNFVRDVIQGLPAELRAGLAITPARERELGWRLLEVGLQTQNLSLFRSTLKLISFESSTLKKWKVLLSGLSMYPNYCQLLLIEAADRGRDAMNSVFFEIFPSRNPLRSWLLELLLQLLERRKMSPDQLFWLKFTHPRQLRRLREILQVQVQHGQTSLVFKDSRQHFSGAQMLIRQLEAGAGLEIVQSLWVELVTPDPFEIDYHLDGILSAAMTSIDPQVPQFLIEALPEMTLDPAIHPVAQHDDEAGHALTAYVDRSRALFERLLPLMRAAAQQVQAEGVPTLKVRLALQALPAGLAFSMDSWLSLMTQPFGVNFQHWRQSTGLAVLKRLQEYRASEGGLKLRLVLLGLGYNDPIPAGLDHEAARALVQFCAAYQSLEVVARLVPALEEQADYVLDFACTYGRPDIVEWFLETYPDQQDMAHEWVGELEGIPGRETVLEILRRYQ